MEDGTLEMLHEKTSSHLGCKTLFSAEISSFDIVSNEIIADLNMLGFLSTRLLSIVNKQHGALIVLEHYAIGDGISLAL